MSDERRPSDKDRHAAKTTIVGGQPPGNARDLPPIPAGLEELLGIAAVEQRFAEVLVSNEQNERQRAVDASGVELTATERTILASVGEGALKQMVSRLALTEQDRRYFISRAATVVVALIGGGAAIASTGCRDRSGGQAVTGARPDRPEEPQTKPDQSCSKSKSVTPVGSRPTRPSELEVETGARPDRPDTSGGKGGARPDRPTPKPRPGPAPPTGARPDRPPEKKPDKKPKRPEKKPEPPKKTRGIRPDRPRTRGISPDRPDRRMLNPFEDSE
jgi:hypothetical protein